MIIHITKLAAILYLIGLFCFCFQCPVRTGPDIAAGLFVCSLFLEVCCEEDLLLGYLSHVVDHSIILLNSGTDVFFSLFLVD